MKTNDKFIGLDVHKDTIVIAIAEGGRGGEERAYGTISNDLHALEKTLRKLGGEGVTLHVVYVRAQTRARRVRGWSGLPAFRRASPRVVWSILLGFIQYSL